MRTKLSISYFPVLLAILSLAIVSFAQTSSSGQKQTGSSTGMSNGQTGSNYSGNTQTTQVTGTIREVKHHDQTTMYEIKLKDASTGKTRDIYVSPSAKIMQNDQKVTESVLQKGATVQVDVYTTPSGGMTAKTITVTNSSPTSKP